MRPARSTLTAIACRGRIRHFAAFFRAAGGEGGGKGAEAAGADAATARPCALWSGSCSGPWAGRSRWRALCVMPYAARARARRWFVGGCCTAAVLLAAAIVVAGVMVFAVHAEIGGAVASLPGA